MYTLIERLCSDYYEVGIEFESADDGFWWGKGLVKRRDTGEAIRGGHVILDDVRDQIEKDIVKHLENLVQSLPTPPSDWNSNILKTIALYLQSKRKIVNFMTSIEEIMTGNVPDESLFDDIARFSKIQITDTIAIVKSIQKLSADERKELLVSKEEVYDDPDDYWNIDDFTARLELFEYVLNPSSEEIKKHQLHVSRCNIISDRNEALYSKMLKDEKNIPS